MALPRTMRAAVVEKFGQPLVIREVPVPMPGPGQALVEIVSSGVCHTLPMLEVLARGFEITVSELLKGV